MYNAIEACFVEVYGRSLDWPKVWNFIAVKLRVEFKFANKLQTYAGSILQIQSTAMLSD